MAVCLARVGLGFSGMTGKGGGVMSLEALILDLVTFRKRKAHARIALPCV